MNQNITVMIPQENIQEASEFLDFVKTLDNEKLNGFFQFLQGVNYGLKLGEMNQGQKEKNPA